MLVFVNFILNYFILKTKIKETKTKSNSWPLLYFHMNLRIQTYTKTYKNTFQPHTNTVSISKTVTLSSVLFINLATLSRLLREPCTCTKDDLNTVDTTTDDVVKRALCHRQDDRDNIFYKHWNETS